MKTNKEKLRAMLNNGVRELTDDELKMLVELELSKDETEIDTQFIDLCFELMEFDYAKGRRVYFTKPVKLTFLAAVILVLMVSGLSVVANNKGSSPVKKLPVVSESTTVEEQDDVPTTMNKSGSNYYSGSGAKTDGIQTCVVPDLSQGNYYEEEILEDEELNENFSITFEYAKGDIALNGRVIIDQSIAPGTVVQKGSEIVLTVNEFSTEVNAPSFTGMTVQEALDSRYGAMFDLIITASDGSAPEADAVIVSQNPSADETVFRGDKIYLIAEQSRQDGQMQPR
ncbi:MAG: PASTA domain-containing protein [Eubacterium sp.]|nr:PASTA domain-containing protein [Eubacterium sp.]